MHHLPGLDRDLDCLPDDMWERGWVAVVAELLYETDHAGAVRALVAVRARYRRMAARSADPGPLTRIRLCRARLAPWQARIIRRLSRTVTDRQAAALFGVSQSSISRARSGRTWYWLDGRRETG